MSTRFRSCSLDQPFLMPPSLQDWLPQEHLARFISEVMEELDLQPILQQYQRKDGRGAEGYHPVMLTRLLLYGYCVGEASSRKIERATYEDVAFRYLAADQHPDHDTIAHFRQEHLPRLSELFVQGLKLCREAGLMQVGMVILDGTKIAANANRGKTLDHEKLQRREAELEQKVAELLAAAEATDAAEDALYGKGRRGDELPAELATQEQRLKRIREAKARLEQERKEKAEEARREQEEHKAKGQPASATQRKRWNRARKAEEQSAGSINLTDGDSRIMKGGNGGGYVQGYNCQAAVLENQIIVAQEVTDQAADKQQLAPMAKKIEEALGSKPPMLLADSGYWSEESIEDERLQGIDLYVPPDGGKPGAAPKPNAPHSEQAQKMREKLARKEGAEVYRLRQQTVEPVFGQVKQVRGFRRFLLRGLKQVNGEYGLICLTHNLLKLYRHRRRKAHAKFALARA
jgi:transposase